MLVVQVATGRNYQVAAFGAALEGGFDGVVPVPVDQLRGVRVAARAGERLAIVGDRDVKADQAGGAGEGLADVAAPKNEQAGLDHGFEKDFELAATDEAAVGVIALVEGKVERARALVAHRVEGGFEDFRFEAATADGPQDRAVLAHEHAHRLLARGRARGLGDRAEGGGPPRVAEPQQLLPNRFHTGQSSSPRGKNTRDQSA